jgi:hypothetical protein
MVNLRQWLYPKEFRINSQNISLKHFNLNGVIEAIKLLYKGPPPPRIDKKFIKEVATSTWRLEKRIKLYSGKDEISKIKTAMNLMKDMIKDFKIEIKDYSGEKWKPSYEGIPWDEQQGDGDTIRMLTPCIRLDGDVIQRGKIILE